MCCQAWPMWWQRTARRTSAAQCGCWSAMSTVRRMATVPWQIPPVCPPPGRCRNKGWPMPKATMSLFDGHCENSIGGGRSQDRHLWAFCVNAQKNFSSAERRMNRACDTRAQPIVPVQGRCKAFALAMPLAATCRAQLENARAVLAVGVGWACLGQTRLRLTGLVPCACHA